MISSAARTGASALVDGQIRMAGRHTLVGGADSQQVSAANYFTQAGISGSDSGESMVEDSSSDDSGDLSDMAQAAAAGSGSPHSGAVLSATVGGQGYHWKHLFWQSLAFTGVEDTYRFSTDAYMRVLVADGPYWHNYIASLEQWNMRRWNDGDSFLVDYIGHPMQGGVSGFIEIQNSPRQKYLRFSGSKEYWRSRLLAMTWSTAFSTQQKIGPLGEAALGSAGGYTYALHCPSPCKYVPGVTKYTNNTGWTDFITTPTIGTLWTVLEDFLDLHVSDPIERRNPGGLAPRIIRGALNPTRTLANAMRGKNPWYRDYKHMPIVAANEPRGPGVPGESFLDRGENLKATMPRFELFPHFDAISLPVNTATCLHCRQMSYGSGIGFSSAITRFVAFDSDVNYHSNPSPIASDRAGGNLIMGTFGFRSGLSTRWWAIRAAIRPGFVSYDKALESSPSKDNPSPSVGRITHFATALSLSTERNLSSHFAVRFVVQNVPIRYREAKLGREGPGKPPYLNWLSKETFATNENWSYQTGMVLRF